MYLCPIPKFVGGGTFDIVSPIFKIVGGGGSPGFAPMSTGQEMFCENFRNFKVS